MKMGCLALHCIWGWMQDRLLMDGLFRPHFLKTSRSMYAKPPLTMATRRHGPSLSRLHTAWSIIRSMRYANTTTLFPFSIVCCCSRPDAKWHLGKGWMHASRAVCCTLLLYYLQKSSYHLSIPYPSQYPQPSSYPLRHLLWCCALRCCCHRHLRC